jgi:P27 family predicted phage terminase small subunit
MNRKAPELHLIDGTHKRAAIQAAPIPEQLKKRIPQAEWMDNFDAWNKAQFIDETSQFLYEVYGIGNNQDKHALAMLADHIDTYINCTKGILANGITVTLDNSMIVVNPYVNVRHKTMTLILQLMNELGLTPRSRLASGKVESESEVAIFMRGPEG